MKKGFTLLEIIIVIIIIGVLASLALPRLFRVVEYSRSAEAMAMFSSIRASMERCYLMQDGNYKPCAIGGFDMLDIDNPGTAPNAHFTYTLTKGWNDPAKEYYITAYRTALDGGDIYDEIVYFYYPVECKKDITIWVSDIGSGIFDSLNTFDSDCY